MELRFQNFLSEKRMLCLRCKTTSSEGRISAFAPRFVFQEHKTMSDGKTKWQTWKVVHRDCVLGPTFQKTGDDDREYCEIGDGSGQYAVVLESDFPSGTLFDVEVRITPK